MGRGGRGRGGWRESAARVEVLGFRAEGVEGLGV